MDSKVPGVRFWEWASQPRTIAAAELFVSVGLQPWPPATGFGRRIVEFGDKLGSGKQGADDFTLHADSAAVDDPEGLQTHPVRFPQVLIHHVANVPRRHAMEVKHVGDRNPYRVRVHWSF